MLTNPGFWAFLPHNEIDFWLEFEVWLHLAYFKENRRKASRILVKLVKPILDRKRDGELVKDYKKIKNRGL